MHLASGLYLDIWYDFNQITPGINVFLQCPQPDIEIRSLCPAHFTSSSHLCGAKTPTNNINNNEELEEEGSTEAHWWGAWLFRINTVTLPSPSPLQVSHKLWRYWGFTIHFCPDTWGVMDLYYWAWFSLSQTSTFFTLVTGQEAFIYAYRKCFVLWLTGKPTKQNLMIVSCVNLLWWNEINDN